MKKQINILNYLQALSLPTILIFTMCVFSIMLSTLRVVATGSPMFLFLNWNLVLAAIPLLLTRYVKHKHAILSKTSFVLLLSAWLFFFPNSPYILTDLFHLKKDSGMPIWFDLILILSYAWAALWLGFKSLSDVEDISRTRLGDRKTVYLIIGLLFAASFGVYLGRFLRWNTWDILINPMDLFADILDRFMHPLHHLRTWGVTLLMGCFLNLTYFSLKSFTKNHF